MIRVKECFAEYKSTKLEGTGCYWDIVTKKLETVVNEFLEETSLSREKLISIQYYNKITKDVDGNDNHENFAVIIWGN